MIIIEGADNVGKTTLAQKLAELMARHFGKQEWRAHYRHMTRPPPDFDHVSGYFEGVGSVVQDRYHLGAIVYGMMLGRGGYPDAQGMRHVQRYLAWRGALVVVMTSNRDSLRERLRKSTKQEMYEQGVILAANDCFRALSTQHNQGAPYCDRVIDVTDGWPGQAEEELLMAEWRSRWTS